MALIYAFMVTIDAYKIVLQHGLFENFTTGPQKIYRLSRINHLRVAYLIHYPEKWRQSLWCRSGQVEATAVTLCHGKLNCWPINSVYRFYIQ